VIRALVIGKVSSHQPRGISLRSSGCSSAHLVVVDNFTSTFNSFSCVACRELLPRERCIVPRYLRYAVISRNIERHLEERRRSRICGGFLRNALSRAGHASERARCLQRERERGGGGREERGPDCVRGYKKTWDFSPEITSPSTSGGRRDAEPGRARDSAMRRGAIPVAAAIYHVASRRCRMTCVPSGFP